MTGPGFDLERLRQEYLQAVSEHFVIWTNIDGALFEFPPTFEEWLQRQTPEFRAERLLPND